MDWLRQLPLGQYVDEGSEGGGWLRRLDPRLKFAWTLAFLITPILAGPLWRLGLVGLLLLITAVSGLPLRLWRRGLPALLLLSLLVGILAALLPAAPAPSQPLQRPPTELRLAPVEPGQPPPERLGRRWEVLRWGPVRVGEASLGPLVVSRRSAELGLNGATLLFTLVHSANLLLLTTSPEELVWVISGWVRPLGALGWSVERLGFTLLLALRFLPLVQEELQNLLRSLATRAVSLRALGWKAGLALVLALGERLLANLLLRAEQGAEALLARGGRWIPPAELHDPPQGAAAATWIGAAALLALLGLRLLAGFH